MALHKPHLVDSGTLRHWGLSRLRQGQKPGLTRTRANDNHRSRTQWKGLDEPAVKARLRQYWHRPRGAVGGRAGHGGVGCFVLYDKGPQDRDCPRHRVDIPVTRGWVPLALLAGSCRPWPAGQVRGATGCQRPKEPPHLAHGGPTSTQWYPVPITTPPSEPEVHHNLAPDRLLDSP